jgi:hypothetical protein
MLSLSIVFLLPNVFTDFILSILSYVKLTLRVSWGFPILGFHCNKCPSDKNETSTAMLDTLICSDHWGILALGAASDYTEFVL